MVSTQREYFGRRKTEKQRTLKVVRGLLGTNPPDPTLEYASPPPPLTAAFREGDEHSHFSVFRVRRFSEWPEPLH